MTILKNIRAKNQVRYDEAGEGVGRSDPMEGMKKQKGEVTKQIEQLKEAEAQTKSAIQSMRNEIARWQSSDMPQLSKAINQIQGEIAKDKVQISELKKAIYDTKVQIKVENDANSTKIYESKIAEYENAIGQYEDRVKNHSKELEKYKTNLDQIKQAISARNQQIQQQQQYLANIQANLVQANAQKKGLEIQLKYMAGAALKQKEIQKNTNKKVDAVHAEQGTVAG